MAKTGKWWFWKLAGCLVVLALAGCSNDEPETSVGPDPAPARQGLNGTVEFWQGNFMPMVGPSVPGGSITPVIRELHIHAATTRDNVVTDGYGGFYSEVNSAWVQTVTSDSQGHFSADLPVGMYSIFVWEQDRYYANGTNYGYINPVTVLEGMVVQVRVKIDYQAYY